MAHHTSMLLPVSAGARSKASAALGATSCAAVDHNSADLSLLQSVVNRTGARPSKTSSTKLNPWLHAQNSRMWLRNVC